MRVHSGIWLLAAATSLAAISVAQKTPGAVQPAACRCSTPSSDARVDINHASADELLKVPGMTRTWADRIVRFRPYRTKQDLVDRGVLTTAAYDRIKDAVIAHRDKQ